MDERTIVALDYDGTWTEIDDEIKGTLLQLLHSKFWVICVSNRDDTEDNRIEIEANFALWRTDCPSISVYLAGPEISKRRFLASKGIRGKILWIDDLPESVGDHPDKTVANQNLEIVSLREVVERQRTAINAMDCKIHALRRAIRNLEEAVK